MDLLAPSSATATSNVMPSAAASPQAPSQPSKQAFEAALSAALNTANVLADAGGSDDDDDGSTLTVKNSMSL